MEYKYDDLSNYIDSVSERGYEKFPKVVLVNTSDVLNGKVLNKDKIENKNLKGQFKKTFKKGDILFSEIRPINKRFANIDFNPDGYVASTKLMVLRKKSDEILRDYIYYFLTSDETLNYLQNQAESRSGTFPQITFKNIAELKIRVPDIYEQVRIVDMLKNIDKKIEVNNKIIANLEEQAQAIFKSWFVDFEPFQDGNFVDSELGMIPEGWEVKELGDFIPVVTGKKNANIANDNGEYPFFTCSQEIFKTDDYSFDANAILLAGNGDFNVKRYNGKFEAYQRTYVLIPKNEKHVGWLYNLIKYFLRDIVSGYKGSVINYITKGMIENFKIAVPRNIDELNVLSIFNDFELMISNINNENKKLAEIRDALLPKLMSGEIDVSNIKIKGEEVKK